ncbi:peroxisome biogenesis protein 2 [Dorcoceras hygrometricum]|uniref:Peroxisome biogenesis protein 2 n=1 Tax=Dorcoceras hygrometricum TaxID=472368 RepID=A0A2Z7DIC1_9LAMI|nr:peroxisome biogenesis protein 2 [Dorcoceras hygrometricum]
MSLFDLHDVCIAIGSIETLDLPKVVDLIGIYGLKGPYCTLTTTDWFLQALSVIPRGSWGDVARRFTMIRWATLLVQPDEGVSDLVMDRIGDNLPQSTEKSRIIVIPVGARHKCQQGPRPEGRLLRQPALEGLTRSARTDSPQKVGRNKFRRGAATQGARRRRRTVDSSIRSTTGRETPSSTCTRRPDEISTDGFSSKGWPEQIPARGGDARRKAAAAQGARRQRYEGEEGAACCRVRV